jgi:hypothetical protein
LCVPSSGIGRRQSTCLSDTWLAILSDDQTLQRIIMVVPGSAERPAVLINRFGADSGALEARVPGAQNPDWEELRAMGSLHHANGQ